jgi:hypothetical protein
VVQHRVMQDDDSRLLQSAPVDIGVKLIVSYVV